MASKTFEDLDLSREEVKRIETALKDEKFRKMFVEYAEEISNPENRKLYEEEIAMLERERGMDVEFINPTPGHVLKTTVDGGKKAFINICQNDKIAKPTSQRETSAGKRGLHWQIPHSFTPPREDFDKAKQTCIVYDVVFHPDTYRMTSNKAFLKLVEDTAIEGIERQFNVKLDKNNIRRPNMKSKGSLPATVIRNRKDGSKNKSKEDNDPLDGMPYPYGDKTSAELAEEMGNNAEKMAKAKETKENKTKSNMVIKEENGFTTPKFTILHRTDMDLQEYRNAPDSRPSTRPKELMITIELPLCKSAAGVDLDIFEENLSLKSEKPAYKLDLKLPYPVDDDNGSARFDKSKKALVVTLPVIPGEIPKMPTFIDELKTSEQNDVPPLIEELPPLEDVSETKEPAYEDLPPLEDLDLNEAVGETVTTQAPLTKNSEFVYSLPEYTFSQDSETVTFVFHVRNISDQSVSKSFPTPGECQVKFVSVGSGGYPMHYSFYCMFDDHCNMVPEHCTTDIIGRNMTLTFLKQKECRQLWNKFWAGVDRSSAQEKIFVTTDNLQAELDKLQTEGEKMGQTDETSPDSHSADLKVTEMNEKKLTLNIRKATSSFSEEDEDGFVDDLPSSAGIEVVHSQAPPNLHGILKQRSVSESSDDPSSMSSSDSPTSLSPRDSDGVKRCVTFNSKIDKTTFKTNAAVTTMKQALKSKRKRNRQREEKKRNRENRKRHNSNGSECSSCDEHDGRHSSESHSEDDVETEDLAQQLEATGKKIEDCGVIEEIQEEAEDKSEQDVNSEENKQDESDESKKPGYQIQSEKSSELEGKPSKLALQVKSKMAERKSEMSDSDDDFGYDNDERTIESGEKQGLVTKVENQEKDVNKTSLENGKPEKSVENDLNVDESVAANKNSGATTVNGDKTSAIKGDNPGKGSKKKGVKFAEDSKQNKSDENGDGDKKGPDELEPLKSDVETELTWHETNKHDPYNQHRTQCAFDFSNSVMFDLDID